MESGHTVSAVFAATAELYTVIQQGLAYDAVKLCHSGTICSCKAHRTLCRRWILFSAGSTITLLLSMTYRAPSSCSRGLSDRLRGWIAKRATIESSHCIWRVSGFTSHCRSGVLTTLLITSRYRRWLRVTTSTVTERALAGRPAGRLLAGTWMSYRTLHEE